MWYNITLQRVQCFFKSTFVNDIFFSTFSIIFRPKICFLKTFYKKILKYLNYYYLKIYIFSKNYSLFCLIWWRGALIYGSLVVEEEEQPKSRTKTYWRLVNLNSWYSDGKNTHKYTQQVNNRRAEILFPRDRFVIHVKKSHTSKLWDFGINTFLEFLQVSKWNDPGVLVGGQLSSMLKEGVIPSC